MQASKRLWPQTEDVKGQHVATRSKRLRADLATAAFARTASLGHWPSPEADAGWLDWCLHGRTATIPVASSASPLAKVACDVGVVTFVVAGVIRLPESLRVDVSQTPRPAIPGGASCVRAGRWVPRPSAARTRRGSADPEMGRP